MPNHLKLRITQEMSYVLTPARKKIIQANNFVAFGNKALAKVRTDESRTACNQYSHLTLFLLFSEVLWALLAQSAGIRTVARYAGILLKGTL
jgi:hypothetical protein